MFPDLKAFAIHNGYVVECFSGLKSVVYKRVNLFRYNEDYVRFVLFCLHESGMRGSLLH